MNSIWTKDVRLPSFPTLAGDLNTEVLIIGGGIAGILCAHFLQEKGVDYVLLEKKTICSGVTEYTTAKITSQHGVIYHKLLNEIGPELTAKYLRANQEAVKMYARLCQDIDCDFETKTSYVYTINDRRVLEEEANALARLGQKSRIEEKPELPFPVAGAIAMEKQAQFQPLRFLSKIAENLHIYEHTLVKEFKEKEALTDHGTVHFQKAIFATHFPMDNKHGMYFLKLYQHRSYVIALKDAPKINGMYVDEAPNGMSFRNYREYLLIGGGDHRTGKIGGNWEELRRFAKEYYPKATEVGCWATQDCMSLDQIPYIGQYARTLPNCFVATGFNKWGMTSSMAAAMILSDLVMEKANPYQEVFNPSRSMLKPQLFLNGFEAVKSWLTVTSKRCPHMGCALKWNSAEHSWDCPCHGSRFDEQGKLLDNPANGDMNIQK